MLCSTCNVHFTFFFAYRIKIWRTSANWRQITKYLVVNHIQNHVLWKRSHPKLVGNYYIVFTITQFIYIIHIIYIYIYIWTRNQCVYVLYSEDKQNTQHFFDEFLNFLILSHMYILYVYIYIYIYISERTKNTKMFQQ